MSILPILTSLYNNAGLTPLTGHNSYHFFNWKDAPFTTFMADGEMMGCPGLALQEVMFLEHLGQYLAPKNCLVIGNAMGWSTIATGLTFPKATTYGIDNAAQTGIDFTNLAFQALNLKGGAVLGESPKDLKAIIDQYLDDAPEFILIDAIHTNEAMLADFLECQKYASSNCVYLFHDVINWNMIEAFQTIQAQSGLQGKLLTRTPSGMAIFYPENISKDFRSYIDVFSDDPVLFESYRQKIKQALKI